MPQYTNNYLRAERGEHWKLLLQPPVEPKPDTRQGVRIAVDPRPSVGYAPDESLEDIKTALKELNYGFRRPTKSQARKLYHRAQIGLLSYETLPIDELRHFINHRGLKTRTPKKGRFDRVQNRPALLQTLEEADDNLIFDHFADLPEEVLLIIMDFYFQSLPNLSVPRKARPLVLPLTHASRLTRRLSLPIFYRLNHFTLVLDVPMYQALRCGVTTFHDPFWLDAMGGNFARITKIRFVIHSEFVYPGSTASGERFNRHHWSIDFKSEGTVTPLGRESSVRTDPLTLVDDSTFAAVDRELLSTVKVIVPKCTAVRETKNTTTSAYSLAQIVNAIVNNKGQINAL